MASTDRFNRIATNNSRYSYATAYNANTKTISGRAPRGSQVPVYVDNTLNGTATADDSGLWALVLSGTIAPGQTVKTGNAVGNGVNQRIFTIPNPVTLTALSLAPKPPHARVQTPVIGQLFEAFIQGGSGGTFSVSGAGAPGLTVSGNLIYGYPVAAGAWNIAETLDTATNSPRTTNAVATTTNGSVVAPVAKHAFGNRMVLQTQAFVSITNQTNGAYHMVDVSPSWDTMSPQLSFAGFIANEIPLGNDYNVEGVWIEVVGTKYDLKVNGSTSFVVPNGGFVVTDEDDSIKIPANTVIRIGWANNAAIGLSRPSGGAVVLPTATYGTADGRGDMLIASGSSLLATAKANTTGNQVGVPGAALYYGAPIAACAKPDGAAAIAAAKSVLVVGDSIGWGANDNAFFYGMTAAEGGAQGYVSRGLGDTTNGRIPRINLCVPGTRYPDLGVGNPAESGSGGTTVKGFGVRAAILAAMGNPFSTIICEMGINTVSNETGTAQQIADNTRAKALAAWTYLKTLGNKKLIQTTMTPQTQSVTDGGATNYFKWSSADETKQTRGADGAHVALDAYIVSKPAPLDAVIDVRPYLESSSGSRKWSRPANQQGTLTAAVSANATTFQMTGWLPSLGDAIIMTPGDTTDTTDSPVIVAVSGNASASTITVRNSSQITKAHASGDAVIGIFTNDGTHTTTQGARAAKQAIIASKSLIV
jgi:hypothetical protein